MAGIDLAENGELYNYTNGSNVTLPSENRNQSQMPEDTQACLLYSFIMYSVVCAGLCLFGTIGNILSFIVFWKDSLKTSTSFLFQALALIDTCMLIVVFPVYCIFPIVRYLNTLQNYWFVHQYVLVYVLPIALTAQTATIWVTVLVGVNRYIAVCKPYQAARLCTVTQARKQLALVLACSVLYNIPRFFSAKIETKFSSTFNSTINEAAHTELGNDFVFNIIYNNILYVIVLLTMPILILAVLNIRLISALQELKRKRAEMQNRQQQQDNNVTLVLIIVVIVFITCQMPALINQIMWNTLPDASRQCGGFQFYFQRISNCLVILNSSVNFLIYLWFNTRFKQVLSQLVPICGYEPDHKHKPMRVASCNTNHKREVDGTTQTLL